MDGPCWSGSAVGAVGGTAGPVTLHKLVGEGALGRTLAPSGGERRRRDESNGQIDGQNIDIYVD